MKHVDMLVKDCGDPALQSAFRAYFAELGVQIRDWDGLFREIGAGPDMFFVRRDEAGKIVGFLLFAVAEAAAWRGFFTAKVGCVEEFWVDPSCRGQGHGAALLARAEAYMRQEGCAFVLLTTDTAPEFYGRQGYSPQPGIRAKNGDMVYAKVLK